MRGVECVWWEKGNMRPGMREQRTFMRGVAFDQRSERQ